MAFGTRAPRCERELEWRWLECECELGREPERVVRWQPRFLLKLLVFLSLSGESFALYSPYPAANHFPYFIRDWLAGLITPIQNFLKTRFKLELHPEKIFIKTLTSGVDFLGWVNFLDHRVLRTSTKSRMFKKIEQNPANETLNSYLGLLKHGNTYGLKIRLTNIDQFCYYL